MVYSINNNNLTSNNVAQLNNPNISINKVNNSANISDEKNDNISETNPFLIWAQNRTTILKKDYNISTTPIYKSYEILQKGDIILMTNGRDENGKDTFAWYIYIDSIQNQNKTSLYIILSKKTYLDPTDPTKYCTYILDSFIPYYTGISLKIVNNTDKNIIIKDLDDIQTKNLIIPKINQTKDLINDTQNKTHELENATNETGQAYDKQLVSVAASGTLSVLILGVVILAATSVISGGTSVIIISGICVVGSVFSLLWGLLA